MRVIAPRSRPPKATRYTTRPPKGNTTWPLKATRTWPLMGNTYWAPEAQFSRWKYIHKMSRLFQSTTAEVYPQNLMVEVYPLASCSEPSITLLCCLHLSVLPLVTSNDLPSSRLSRPDNVSLVLSNGFPNMSSCRTISPASGSEPLITSLRCLPRPVERSPPYIVCLVLSNSFSGFLW